MARPKLHRNSAELDAEITRIQREAEAQLQRLLEERRDAEGREDRRRGEVIRACLTGAHAEEVRRVLALCVAPKDAALFGRPGPGAGAAPAPQDVARAPGDGGPIVTD
jgi:hypothetical protein